MSYKCQEKREEFLDFFSAVCEDMGLKEVARSEESITIELKDGGLKILSNREITFMIGYIAGTIQNLLEGKELEPEYRER